jgi:hypothetical protein
MEREKELNISGESGEPGIFTLGRLGKGGLPEDLNNTSSGIGAVLSMQESGTLTEKQMREELKSAKTFEDYFLSQLSRYNEAGSSFDPEASLKAEKAKLNPEAVESFNEKMLKIREFADKKKINRESVRKIISEIKDLVYGKEKK